jgi:hypothetical protein
MQAEDIRRGYYVSRHGNWQMVDMVLVTFVNAIPETEAVETRRLVLACGCTLRFEADAEVEAIDGRADRSKPPIQAGAD